MGGEIEEYGLTIGFIPTLVDATEAIDIEIAVEIEEKGSTQSVGKVTWTPITQAQEVVDFEPERGNFELEDWRDRSSKT